MVNTTGTPIPDRVRDHTAWIEPIERLFLDFTLTVNVYLAPGNVNLTYVQHSSLLGLPNQFAISAENSALAWKTSTVVGSL